MQIYILSPLTKTLPLPRFFRILLELEFLNKGIIKIYIAFYNDEDTRLRL